MKMFFDRLMSLAKFEENAAEEIRADLDHERHTLKWNERYWHGYAAAMRHIQEQLNSYELLIHGSNRKMSKNES